jgi:hypothetical protein
MQLGPEHVPLAYRACEPRTSRSTSRPIDRRSAGALPRLLDVDFATSKKGGRPHPTLRAVHETRSGASCSSRRLSAT